MWWRRLRVGCWLGCRCRVLRILMLRWRRRTRLYRRGGGCRRSPGPASYSSCVSASWRGRRTWRDRSRPRWARRSAMPAPRSPRMIEMVECACAIPTTMQGRILEDVARGIDAETVRQPVGVCAAIVPFNFPAMVPFWFLPFAIACGNTFVLKPSEQVPLTQQIAFEELDALELPAGRRQPRQRRPRGRRGDPRAPRHRRGLVRRLGAGRAARLRAGGKSRQAGPGARRRQEPHGRDAGRRDRQDRRRHHRLRIRRRRPALHGRLGRRHRRRRPRAADAAARRGDAGADASATALRRRRTSAR